MVSPNHSLAYERWANRGMLNHLRHLADPPGRAVKLFAHTLSGIKVWLVRIRGEDSSGIEIWPEWSLEDCEAAITDFDESVSGLLQSLDGRDLSETINYTNQHGLAYTTSIADVLFHLASHGAYHRGQICVILREAGLQPLNTDYITFVRELAGQAWRP